MISLKLAYRYVEFSLIFFTVIFLNCIFQKPAFASVGDIGHWQDSLGGQIPDTTFSSGFEFDNEIGESSECDWSVENYNAVANTTYCFRMIKGDDSAFDTYNADSYPKLTTAPDTGNLLRHGDIWQNDTEQGFYWANCNYKIVKYLFHLYIKNIELFHA